MTEEAIRTRADEIANIIVARTTILTRCCGAFVDLGLAACALKARGAYACVAAETRNTKRVVEAWRARTAVCSRWRF